MKKLLVIGLILNSVSALAQTQTCKLYFSPISETFISKFDKKIASKLEGKGYKLVYSESEADFEYYYSGYCYAGGADSACDEAHGYTYLKDLKRSGKTLDIFFANKSWIGNASSEVSILKGVKHLPECSELNIKRSIF